MERGTSLTQHKGLAEDSPTPSGGCSGSQGDAVGPLRGRAQKEQNARAPGHEVEQEKSGKNEKKEEERGTAQDKQCLRLT